jgi:4-amino-4-deoxy-L-arabinose transferase-like glycosyltransferase
MTISRSERLLAMGVAAVTLAMRAVAFFHYRFDSDEPQHLHVAWGWTAGLLQYRDVFDNHAPLFHMAAAPLLRILGERSDILLYMRAPMLVLWIIVSVATFAIARRLYDDRVAIWSVLLLNVLPPFFLKSIEFRTDNLWDAFWMAAVAVLVLSRRSTIAFFVAGLLLGGAFAVSLKTTLLLITLAAAAAVTYAMLPTKQRVHLFALAAGFVVIPAIIAGYFGSRGAWGNFIDCAFRFNELVTVTRSPVMVWTPRLLFIPLMIVVLRIAWRYRQATTNARFFFAIATAIFFSALCGFWILISPRDFLPFLPFVSIFAVAALIRRPHFARNVVMLILVCLIGVGYYAQWLTNRTREFITMERQVLNLTRPGEMVMDYKGETIYRRRPYYFILEFITRNAILHGLVADTVPEDLVRAGCHVAQADGSQWPDRARAFMGANFLNLGRLRASGQWIAADGSFSIAIPGKYVIIGAAGSPRGLLDGTPYREARQLAAGVHTFKYGIGGPDERLACLWAPAWWRGFSPFHLRDLDF